MNYNLLQLLLKYSLSLVYFSDYNMRNKSL